MLSCWNEQAAGLGVSDKPEDEFEEAQMMCSYEYGDWEYDEEN